MSTTTLESDLFERSADRLRNGAAHASEVEDLLSKLTHEERLELDGGDADSAIAQLQLHP